MEGEKKEVLLAKSTQEIADLRAALTQAQLANEQLNNAKKNLESEVQKRDQLLSVKTQNLEQLQARYQALEAKFIELEKKK